MNTIAKIQFHFQMQNEDFACNIYGRWDSFFANNVERILNEELETRYEKLGVKNEDVLVIDKLELDIGNILEEEFDEQFLIRFREKLEEALIQLKVENGELKMTENSLATKFLTFNFQFSILCHFLLHGTLPCNTTDEYKNINHLFSNILQKMPKELKQFLLTYGHYTSLRERLVYQFNDLQLEKGAYLLNPGSGDFIINYVKFFQAKYQYAKQPGITPNDYRNTVWYVIYSYLLTNRSSYFDKKSFVTQTLLQLAGKYNLSYDVLLQLLTSELEYFSDQQAIQQELFQILSQLRKEFTEKQYRESSINAAKFYKTIYRSLLKEINKNIPQNNREALISILSQTGTCRAFLQYLKEEEIIALVPIVTPNESRFVIDVAHQLDTQKEQGTLHGKAGGEFRLLKWQIIFPLLLENKGSLFNRKYFVQQVFSKVAARYNIEVLLLLDFFNQEAKIGKLDKDLQQIISRLIYELQEKQPKKVAEQYFDLFALIKQAINKKIELSSEQLKEIRIQLSAVDFCEKIILQFNETKLFELFTLLYPKLSDEVLSFVENLNIIFKDKNLQSKNVSEFNKQKWNILFTQPENNLLDFNKLINAILEQVEVFYEMSHFELLFAFQDEKISDSLSFDLNKVIENLFKEEKENLRKIVSKLGDKAPISIQKYFLQIPKYVQSVKKSNILLHLKDKLSIFGKKEEALFEKLQQKTKYIEYLQDIFEIIAQLRNYITNELKLTFNNEELLQIFLDLSKSYTALSQTAILERIVKSISLQLPEKYRQTFWEKLEKLERKDILVTQVIERQSKNIRSLNAENQENNNQELKSKIMEKMTNNQTEPIFVNNAGMVLLYPFLQRLFSMLELTENNKFKNKNTQVKAIYLLQYTIFEKTDFPEHELVLNKILTGLAISETVPQNIELSQHEQETINSMLKFILQHWKKLKNTSVSGLQQSFLQREGKLEEKEDAYILTVETKAYDMLLDSVSWNFRMIKFPWMEKRLEVKWR